MPFYVAHGKDAVVESSIKVFASSDEEAFWLAKEKLPIVSGLERIEADGSMVPVTQVPLDSIQQEVVSADERRLEYGKKVERSQRDLRKAFVLLAALAAFILYESTCARFYPRLPTAPSNRP